MKIYLAGLSSKPELEKEMPIKYQLESILTIKDYQIDLLPQKKGFILDSGIYTFLAKQKKGKNPIDINWDEYTKKYATFINKHNINLYFEIDADAFISIEKIEELRYFLEKETGKKPIPVWHKSRGLEYFKKMVKEYPYVAIGGLAIKHIRPTVEQFQWFIHHAHINNSKIHGLGFTNTKLLNQLKFDSVDSTSWQEGGRFANISIFDGKKIIHKSNKNKRLSKGNYLALDKLNLIEWMKFIDYAEEKL